MQRRGRHDVALGVDLARTSFADAPEERDAIAADPDVGAERPQTRAVDDGPVADHEVVGNTVILLAVRATSSEIRARLPHPVIDVDGHMAE